MFEYPIVFFFPLAMAFAGAIDLLTFTIPNRVSLALFVGFIVSVFLAGTPWPLLLSHVAAGITTLFIGLILFTLGWAGGGDAKLMGAAAFWFGFDHLLAFFFWTAVLGGVFALVLLAYRQILPPVWLVGQSWAMRLHDPKEGIPYGIAIAGAALIVYPSTGWMTGFAG